MATIKVTRLGVLPEQFEQNVKIMFLTVNNGLKIMAEATRDHMQDVIRQKTTRRGGTGRLVKSITVEPLVNRTGWGIGNVSYMNSIAPYWYLINYGGFSGAAKHGTTLWGSFSGSPSQPAAQYAGTGVGTQQWIPAGANQMWPMSPKNPVAAKNYIEDTANWASTIWRIHFANRTGTIRISR